MFNSFWILQSAQPFSRWCEKFPGDGYIKVGQVRVKSIFCDVFADKINKCLLLGRRGERESRKHFRVTSEETLLYPFLSRPLPNSGQDNPTSITPVLPVFFLKVEPLFNSRFSKSGKLWSYIVAPSLHWRLIRQLVTCISFRNLHYLKSESRLWALVVEFKITRSSS